MPTLRDGSRVDDHRLDRLVQFDERSRGYPILPIDEALRPKPRSYTWRLGRDGNYVLDQGREGACVGYAVTHELLARPAEVRFGGYSPAQKFARLLYWDAQRIDPWPGGAYPGAYPFYEGTSVLAGVKVAQKLGYFDSYRWSFGIQDLVYGLGHNGPAILGVAWYSSMYQPDGNHFIRPTGSLVGGHAILARGVKLVWKTHKFTWWARTWDDIDLDKSYVIMRNSWGPLYGNKGDCNITLTDLDALLRQDGEAVFFINRKDKV
jgi:hypothetical protein